MADNRPDNALASEDNPVAALLERAAASIRQAAEAATPGPWWCDESDLCWRLHGVGGRTPAMPDLGIGPQVVNWQILKAPKTGTPYAEYWPGEPDAKWITGMHPGVGLAVAAWLEESARRARGAVVRQQLADPQARRFWCRQCERPREPGVTAGGCNCWDHALAVARAWLGETGEG